MLKYLNLFLFIFTLFIRFIDHVHSSKSNCSFGYSGDYCDECGKQFIKPNYRIIGGQEVIKNSWPSIAFILFKYDYFFIRQNITYLYQSKRFCTGTLIDRKTILTAASCYIESIDVFNGGMYQKYQVVLNKFHPTYESMYKVYLGLNDVKDVFYGTSTSPTGTEYLVKSFITHPKFDNNTNLNDIAIIKIIKEVKLNDKIQLACLSDQFTNKIPTGTNITVYSVGWGSTEYKGAVDFKLRDVNFTLYSGSMCENVYSNIEKDWTMQLCAGDIFGLKDICEGDLGAPLFAKSKINGIDKFILIGVASYGYRCGYSPSIFTKVSSYLNWIATNSTENDPIPTKTTRIIPTTASIKLNCNYGYIGSYCDECGKQFFDSNVRIINGKEAVKHSWPSIGLVRFRYEFFYTISNKTYSSKKTYYCGGTLIDRKTVLTAAHCFITEVSVIQNGRFYYFIVKPNDAYPTIQSMYRVYLGLHNKAGAIDDLTSISPGKYYLIENFIIHPKYDTRSNLNDIAIIKLINEVSLNKYIQLACLPNPLIENYPTKTDIPSYSAGWGLNQFDILPDNLQNIKLTLYNSSMCSKVYPNTAKNWNNQICAGNYSGGQDTCEGDSGGPLFIKDKINNIEKFIQVGIISYGFECAKPGYPGIYTKVSSYLNWIYSLLTLTNSTDLRKTTSSPSSRCQYGFTGSNCDECGKEFYKKNVRIVGGKIAIAHSWPSIAWIVFNYKYYYKILNSTYLNTVTFHCGGSLIERSTVLTAAHCYFDQVLVKKNGKVYFSRVKPNRFYPTIASMYRVYFGLHDKTSQSSRTVLMSIKNFTIHPNYNKKNQVNDIAVIKLKNDVKLNNFIQTACLPMIRNYPNRTNITAWASGWGVLENGKMPNKLHNVQLFIYNSSFCKNVAPKFVKNWNKQICAGEYQGKKDTCLGDSGGPLFVKDKINGKEKFILTGITSYGDGCGLKNKPTIYTRVSHYISWISTFYPS